MPGHSCACVIYLAGTAGDVWTALTDPQRSAAYWAHYNVSDWRPGSAWEHRRTDGSGIADIAGTVVESSPPERLVLTWAHPGDGTPVAGAGTDTGTGPAPGGQRPAGIPPASRSASSRTGTSSGSASPTGIWRAKPNATPWRPAGPPCCRT